MMKNRKMKIFLIVCAAVFLTGVAATVTGMAFNGWRDLNKLPGSWHIGDWNIQDSSGNMDTYTLSGNDAKFEAMDLNLALCDVEYKTGNEYRIELTYDEAMNRPDMGITDGVLKVRTGNEHFISEDGNGFVMSLEITVPVGTKLTAADLNLDACEADFSDLQATNLDVSFDLGELTFKLLSFEKAKFNLNACDANIQMIGEEADYYYDVTNDLGSMTIGSHDDDFDSIHSNGTAPYYYQLDADLSDVTVTYQWPSASSN